jgi:GT2 family glycosyltransferase
VDQPLVSVIIPCFRQGHLLSQAVDSALTQSHPAVEVVVVNDGSDDDTAGVARRYRDRISYIFQTNRGLAGARNTGIAAATGRYLLFLDADDQLHPDAVAGLVAAASGREDVVCVGGYRRFTDTPRTSTDDVLPPRTSAPSGLLLTACFGPPHSFLSPRAQVVAVGGFDPAPAGCEDYDLWVRLVLAGCEVIPVYQVVAYYRQQLGSMSTNGELMATGSARVLRRVRKVARESPATIAPLGREPSELLRAVRRQLAREMFDAGYACARKGRYRAAFGYYLASVGYGRLSTLSALCKLPGHWLRRLVRGPH